ncbi:MAG: hypothetical protein ACI8P3_000062 [Saprospiraceae bacterium]|jgi:hypothetical protein
MKNFFFFLLAICLNLLFLSCADQKQHSVSPAFYHWKNSLDLSTAEFNYLSALQIKKLYIRFFDVDWKDSNAVPLSVLECKSNIPDSIEIVPTVFITNQTMLNITEQQIPALGEKILRKVNQLVGSFKNNAIREIQFDCDWSPKSQDKYFQLLLFLRTQLATQNQKISATIRLHQVKYFERTGVPDVDRGVLMFYNMTDIDDPDTENSILNISVAKQYLFNFDAYPLALDLALPIFKWGIVFQEDKFIKIINNLDQNDLRDTTHFSKIDENRFEIIKSTYLKGYYLYKKDQIRLEKTTIGNLQKAADLLSPMISNKDLNIIFYHLDSTLIADYPNEVLKDIYNRFY